MKINVNGDLVLVFVLVPVFVLFIFSSLAYAKPIETIEWEDISDIRDVSQQGRTALSFEPENWKHAETGHFVFHFTDPGTAETFYRQAEETYRWVQSILDIREDQWHNKAHIYVFEDAATWKKFKRIEAPALETADAYTTGKELFIRRSPAWLGAGKVLGHELTHVLLYRFVEGRVPLVLNEGFAEFIGYKAAARAVDGNEYRVRILRLLAPEAYVPLEKFLVTQSYPAGDKTLFYRQSELFVRYLILTYGKEKFHDLLTETARGGDFRNILIKIYQLDFPSLENGFKRFALRK